jgi:hypothetical protein
VPSELKSLVDSNPGKKKWALFGGSKASKMLEWTKHLEMLD